jgi:hypothetical protein
VGHLIAAKEQIKVRLYGIDPTSSPVLCGFVLFSKSVNDGKLKTRNSLALAFLTIASRVFRRISTADGKNC